MNPLKIFSILTVLFVAVSVSSQHQVRSSSNSVRNKWKPTEWLPVSELENMPALDEFELEHFESMPVEEGSDTINKIYHLLQMTRDVTPNWEPEFNKIRAYLVAPNGEKVPFSLHQLVPTLKELPYIGNKELTVYMTGIPEERSEATKKSTRKLIDAYHQRYNLQQKNNNNKRQHEQDDSSEEVKQQHENPTGNLLVIDLGSTLNTSTEYVQINTESIGKKIGKLLVQLTTEADVPQELIHLIGQGVSAHAAGAAARQYTRKTGHKLRRVTGLDPSKVYSQTRNTLTGLSRGDAEFVDAIHTSALSTAARVGNVDFYPNGVSDSMPGTTNLIEASERSVEYFAESVYPGNERNFPAIAAKSMGEYKSNDGYGRRIYMGIAADVDAEGDYILEVNSKSPFGKKTPAKN